MKSRPSFWFLSSLLFAIILQHVVYQANITNNKCPSLIMSAQQATEVNNCQRNWSHLDTVSVGEIVSASCLSRYLSIYLSINPTSILWYSFVIQMCSFTSYRFIFIYFIGRVLNDFVTFFVFFVRYASTNCWKSGFLCNTVC